MTDSVVKPLTDFQAALNADIKDQIYDQVGFLKEDIIGFADQIIFSFKNDFGKCQVRFSQFKWAYLKLDLQL